MKCKVKRAGTFVGLALGWPMSSVALALCLPLVMTSGCVCEAYAALGITVEIRDSVSNAPAALRATLVARDGAYADSMIYMPGPGIDTTVTSLSVTEEREGTYEVTVRKAGYREWRRANVKVNKGPFDCHITPVKLNARLQPIL